VQRGAAIVDTVMAQIVGGPGVTGDVWPDMGVVLCDVCADCDAGIKGHKLTFTPSSGRNPVIGGRFSVVSDA
jgi:hypothetical protein